MSKAGGRAGVRLHNLPRNMVDEDRAKIKYQSLPPADDDKVSPVFANLLKSWPFLLYLV